MPFFGVQPAQADAGGRKGSACLDEGSLQLHGVGSDGLSDDSKRVSPDISVRVHQNHRVRFRIAVSHRASAAPGDRISSRFSNLFAITSLAIITKMVTMQMEKHTPHCKLEVVHSLVRQGRVRKTASALLGAAAMGIDEMGMVAIVASLGKRDFYKSMTTHDDHRIWQDVYRPSTRHGVLYLKLTVVDDVLIVSFKEK
jgi:motility quorum-sensing regulator/GCU-specific mRNA interferase toxin